MQHLLCILVFSLIGGSSSQLAGYGRGGGGGPGRGSGGGGGGGIGGGAGGGAGGGGSLEDSIPGVPGQDYPIYAQVPNTGFSCDGQVDGGKYGDPAAECQAFHICTADGEGGLSTYSFLCPNGTIFNQQYFICDWWFNVDCSQTESLYGLNDQIAAEAASIGGGGGGGAGGRQGGGSGGNGGRGPGGAPGTGYGAPGR